MSLQNLKLPNFIYSHEQLSLYIMQLDSYKSILLKEKTNNNNELGTGELPGGHISDRLYKYLESISENNAIDFDTIEAVHDFFEQAREKAPRLNITLADKASEELKEEIVNWARLNIKNNILISFHIDRHIAGGLIIRTRNKILDLSFDKKLEKPKTSISKILYGKE